MALIACGSRSEAIYFASDRDGQWDIYSSDPNSNEEINLTDTPFACLLYTSPSPRDRG